MLRDVPREETDKLKGKHSKKDHRKATQIVTCGSEKSENQIRKSEDIEKLRQHL